MLIGLKVLSSACKRLLYRPKYNAKSGLLEFNFEGLEVQQWNVPNVPGDRPQRLDEENCIICLVMIFSHSYGPWNIKNVSFFVFSLDEIKKSGSVWAKYLSAPILSTK